MEQQEATENPVAELVCTFRKISGTARAYKAEIAKKVATKKSIASLENENMKLKKRNIFLEQKATELQARLSKLSSHYQSILAERDYKNIQDRLSKSASKALEQENAALSATIAQMEVKLLHAEEQKRESKEKWRLHEQKMDHLIEDMNQLMGRLSGLEKHLAMVHGVCKKLRPSARMLAKRCRSLKLLYSRSRRTVDKLTRQLSAERISAGRREAKLAGALGRLRALAAEIAGYRAAVQEQRDETMVFMKQTDELKSEIEHLEARMDELLEVIRDQSDALSRLFGTCT